MAQFDDNGSQPEISQPAAGARVVDAGGQEASIISIQQGDGHAQAWMQLAEGSQVLVPLSLLAQQQDGTYRLPFALHLSSEGGQPVQLRFPVMEEEVHVTRQSVDTGRGVRIHKTVSEREHVVEQSLQQEELDIEHVPIGRVVDEASLPQVRYEGDTLVVPVLEEVLVVQKQVMLKEEVRITRQRHASQMRQPVVLRSEHVSVERFDQGRKP